MRGFIRSLGAALLAASLLAAPAAAERRISTPLTPAAPDTIPLLACGLPSPETASRLSARGTLYPLAIAGGLVTLGYVNGSDAGMVSILGGSVVGAIGIVFGPVAGYSYGKVGERGTMGMVLRAALVVGTPIVLADARRDAYYDDDFYDFVVVALSGVGLASLSAVWDVSHVSRHVEERNRRLSQTGAVQLEPCATPISGQPALALRLRF